MSEIEILRAEIKEVRRELAKKTEAHAAEVRVLQQELDNARATLTGVDTVLTLLQFPDIDGHTLERRIFDLSRFGERMHGCPTGHEDTEVPEKPMLPSLDTQKTA